MELIDKAAVVAEIEKRIADNKKDIERASHKNLEDYFEGYEDALVLFKEQFLDNLEVKDPYEQCVQYDSIKAGIQAHAEDYSFNIESELFNQLTKEQQVLWRKEIEQACISGGYDGVELARDPRYKENLEVKEVDLDREIRRYRMRNPIIQHREESLYDYIANVAKHFFELGLSVNNKAQKGR